MDYFAKASVEYRPNLNRSNSPSRPVYGEWEREETRVRASSYYSLVRQLEKFYATHEGNIEIESVNLENGGQFSNVGMIKLHEDISRFNARRLS